MNGNAETVMPAEKRPAAGRTRVAGRLAIPVACIVAAAVLGGATNAINGVVSPHYFRVVMGWRTVEDVWRAAVAQGIYEGLLYGAAFAVIFTLVVGLVSRGGASLWFAVPHLLVAWGFAACGWVLGGIAGVGLAVLSPEMYRSTFRGVPAEPWPMAGYAWVGGSIWGVLIGVVLGLILACLSAWAGWRRRSAQAG